MRKIILVLLTFIVILSAQAQQSSHYQLVQPEPAQYLKAINEIAIELSKDFDGPFGYETIDQINEAFFYLYPSSDGFSYDELRDTYSKLNMRQSENVHRRDWVRYMVMQWLIENHIDLSMTDEIGFDDISVSVMPRDFNADGEEEYVLDVVKGQAVDRNKDCWYDADVVDCMVIQGTSGNYQIVQSDLPWKGDAPNGRYSYADGSIIELAFEDITADGLPEWIVLLGTDVSGGPGMGYVESGGLMILGWRDGKLDYLAPTYYDPNKDDEIKQTVDFSYDESDCEGPYPYGIDWKFENIDDDAPMEILLAQRYVDNWICARTETRIFDWNESIDSYDYMETKVDYADDTQTCAQRDTEEVMWTGDYADAIPIFEHALTLKTGDLAIGESYNYLRALNQYLRVRLALTYMMSNQADLATPILEELATETPEDKAIGKFTDVMLDANKNGLSPLEICITAYQTFTVGNPYPDNVPQIRVGYTGDDLYYFNNPYQPENIACNASEMLFGTLTSAHIPVETSPVDYLGSLGVGVDRSLELDMNQDGVSEWLVWTEIPGNEVFFYPGDARYNVKYTHFDPFQKSNNIQEFPLPDDSGTAIAIIGLYFTNFKPWSSMYSPFAGGDMQVSNPCILPDGTESFANRFSIIRWKDGEFENIFNKTQCGASLDSIFSETSNEHLTLMAVECKDDYCSDSDVYPAIYHWDSTLGTYTLPPEDIATPYPTETPYPYPTPILDSCTYYYSIVQAFVERNFDSVTCLINNDIQIDPDTPLNIQLGDYYLRALALEALDRSDEALEQFIAIYEYAPESPMGMLARLHFEPIK